MSCGRVSGSLSATVASIATQDGLKGFSRGILPRTMQMGLGGALYLGTHSYATSVLQRFWGSRGAAPLSDQRVKRVREVLSQLCRAGRAQFGTKSLQRVKAAKRKRPRGPLRAWATLVSCGLGTTTRLYDDAPVAPMHTAIHPPQYAADHATAIERTR